MPHVEDSSIGSWFLSDAERRNSASDIRGWTSGNLVEPLVDGARYFRRLHDVLCRTRAQDQVYFTDFRGDTEELLAGPGTSVGDVLSELAERGVFVSLNQENLQALLLGRPELGSAAPELVLAMA